MDFLAFIVLEHLHFEVHGHRRCGFDEGDGGILRLPQCRAGDFALVRAVHCEDASLVDEPFFGIGQPAALLVLLEFLEELPVEVAAQADLFLPDLNQLGRGVAPDFAFCVKNAVNGFGELLIGLKPVDEFAQPGKTIGFVLERFNDPIDGFGRGADAVETGFVEH